MKNLVMPALLIVPVTVGALWVFSGNQSETEAALPKEAAQDSISQRTSAALRKDVGPRVGRGPFVAPTECSDPLACVVQNHVDLKAGPGVVDAACGARSYDEHQGVDFRILDLPTMMSGVPVVAVADGTVIGARDGEFDGAWLAKGREVVKDRDCGNGISIEHADGYVTQVCHLKRDSLLVEEGDTVKQGQRIGSVGMSGRAEFPHVHLSVTRDGKRVDPFTGLQVGNGRDCGQATGESLWAGVVPDHWQPSAGPFIFKSGFTAEPVNLAMIERRPSNPVAASPALAFYARAVGLQKGDVEKIELTGPDGFEPIGSVGSPLAKGKAQIMRFVGRPAKGEPLPTGEYQGRYQILRGGEPVLDISRNFVLE